jgi:multiple antibiotic resistance protein
MSIFISNLITLTISLFAVMGSLSGGAIMLSLLDESHQNKKNIHQIASKNTIAVLFGSLAVMFIGDYVLSFLGISVDAIKVAGGFVLFLMSINMVQGANQKSINHSQEEHKHNEMRQDIAVVPLAFPVLIGPGVIAALISLKASAKDFEMLLSLVIAVLICSLLNFLILRNMLYIQRALGENGMRIFGRVMGLLVAAIGAQMLIKGVKAIWLM